MYHVVILSKEYAADDNKRLNGLPRMVISN